MKTLALLLLLSALGARLSTSHAAVRLECDPVSTATLYRFHLGTNSMRYTVGQDSVAPSTVFDALPAGQWFAAVTAVNASGLESDFSREITFTVIHPQLDLTVLISTNLNAKLPDWSPLTTVRVSAPAGAVFYRLRLTPVAQIANPTSRISPLARAGSKVGKR